MLYSPDSSSYITEIPHQREYDIWRARLSDADFDAIYADLDSRIDGSKIQTSSWIPGADWTGTVFQPIYEVACKCDANAAALFFGLIVWQVVLEHDQVWSFGRYEKGSFPIEGMTYFRLNNPPPQ